MCAGSPIGSCTREVCRLANALKAQGIRSGDRVVIYMPLVPEAVIAMQACARIGAVHSVVFGGFSAQAVRDRIEDAEAKMVITADGGWRAGHGLDLKGAVDKALAEGCRTVESVIVYARLGGHCEMQSGRDLWWHEMWWTTRARPANPSGSLPNIRCSCCTRPARPAPRRAYSIRVAGFLLNAKLTSRWVFDLTTPTYSGARRTSDGSRDMLRCLWPAGYRRHDRDVRGRAVRSRTAGASGRSARSTGSRPLHGANGDSRADATGRCAAAQLRPRRCGCWAASASRSILRHGCGITASSAAGAAHRRHLVADRDGRDYDQPVPGVTPTKPGSCTQPLPECSSISSMIAAIRSKAPNTGGYLVISKPWPSLRARSGATTRAI